MSTERRSGFGPGFSKEVDAIVSAAELGHLYPDEVRENLRLAGMVLRRRAEMPVFVAEEDPTDFDGEDIYPIDDDTEGEELTDD